MNFAKPLLLALSAVLLLSGHQAQVFPPIQPPATRTGIGAPANSLGSDGDSYVDTTPGFQTFYGPKANGKWPPGLSFGTFDVVKFGAIGNGVADDSAAILNAVNAAHAVGGGVVLFPRAGTYLTGAIPLYSNIHFVGVSEEAVVLKLKPGANSDLFQGSIQGYTNGVNGYTGTNALVNIAAPGIGAAVAGTGNNSGVNSFSIRHLTLDGNVTNQTAYGAGIRVYGYGYRLEDLYIRNFYGDGIYQDWNPNSNSFSLAPNQLEIQLHDVKIHDIGYSLPNSTSMGIRWAGGTDSQWSNVVVYKTGSHGIQIGPNAAALQATQIHVWGIATGNKAVALLNEANGCMFLNFEAEGSDTTQVAIIASQVNWYGGKIFSGGAPGSSYGMQLGQALGDTPYVGSVNQALPGSLANPASPYSGTPYSSVSSRIYAYFENTYAGALYPRNENSNDIQALGNQTTTTPMLLVAGTLSGTDNYILKSHGITDTHVNATAGGQQSVSDANRALTITDLSGHDIFNFNGSSRPFGAGIAQFPGTNASGFRDWFYSTPTWNITHDGFFQSVNSGFAVGSNTTVATASIPAPWVLGNGAMITVYNSAPAPPNTPNPSPEFPYGKVRVTAATAVNGLILQPGAIDGTIVTVINESPYPITFAANPTTSNVATASLALPAGAAQMFMWNAPALLWYAVQ